MMSYLKVLRLCKSLNINPEIVGDNKMVDSQPVLYKPFDLTEIKRFPKKQMEELIMLGQVVYNLNSQLENNFHYNLTSKEGKLKMEKDLKIKKMISVIISTMEFLLFFGLFKSKSEKNLIIYNGQIFEEDEKQMRKMKEMNSYMKEVHSDYKRKEALSERSAQNVILNS